MKYKIVTVMVLILSSFSFMATGASAGSTETNDGTAICRADYAGEGSRYLLLGNGAYETYDCSAITEIFAGADSDGWVNYEFAAWCAHDGEFYTELCKAEDSKMLTWNDFQDPGDQGDIWETECIQLTYYYGGNWKYLARNDCKVLWSDVMS